MINLELLQEEKGYSKRLTSLGAVSPVEPARGAFDSERSMRRSLRQLGLKANHVYFLRISQPALASAFKALHSEQELCAIFSAEIRIEHRKLLQEAAMNP